MNATVAKAAPARKVAGAPILSHSRPARTLAIKAASPVTRPNSPNAVPRRRSGAVAEISAASDSVLFRAAMKSGTGTVLGPDSVSGGWQVVRVNAVLPGQSRSFEEVRDLVLRAWSDEEGERRMQELLAGLRKRAKIVVNRPPLEKLATSGPKTTYR